MDMAIVIGTHKFSLQATIDHHGPCIYSGHFITSVNFCKNIYWNDRKITVFEIIDTKTPVLHM